MRVLVAAACSADCVVPVGSAFATPPIPYGHAMASDPYLRYPTIRGDRVVFVTDDDLWAASVDGGAAWRLGAERATIRTPRWAPGGGGVACPSDAGGHAGVGGPEPAGGEPRRL